LDIVCNFACDDWRNGAAVLFAFGVDDCETGFVVGGLDIGEQAHFKAGAEAVFQGVDFFRRAVTGEDDLPFCFINCVESMEKLLLRSFFAGDELDIV